MVIMGAHVTMQHTSIALELNTFQRKFTGNKNIKTNIHKIQVQDLLNLR